MIGRDAVAVLLEVARVKADDVLAHTPMRTGAGRDRDVVLAGPLNRLFAGRHRHPDRRVRLLHGPWPERHIVVLPELPLVREDFLGPGAADDLPGLFEARPRLALGDVVDVVLARDAAREA